MPFCFKSGIFNSYRLTRIPILLVLVCCILTPVQTRAENRIRENYPGKPDTMGIRKKKYFHFTERGLLFGYGYGINQLNIPEGVYCPIFFVGQFGIQLGKSGLLPGTVSLIIEPQFNIVILRSGIHTDKKFEGGIGVGLQQVFNLTPKFKPFLRLVVGPHYINTHTSLQHTGFLFSDNAVAGFYYFLTDKIALQAQFRARHLSNANLALPNHGINTSNFLAGISWFL